MRSAGRLLIGILSLCYCGLAPETCSADLVNAGDLAFIGFNEDGNDNFAIVLLADAAATDVVHFNDNEWVGAGFNSTAEGEFSWTVGGTGLSAGTVVTFDNVRTNPSVSTPSGNPGTLSGETMSLSAGDTIYAFIGTNATTPTTFLGALSNNVNDYNGTSGTLAGTGLAQGTTAVLLPDSSGNLADGGQYTGARSGEASFSDYVALIGNPSSNWAVDPSNGSQFVPFNTMSFSAASATTPEPPSLSLMFLAAATGALVCLRSRSRRDSRQNSPC